MSASHSSPTNGIDLIVLPLSPVSLGALPANSVARWLSPKPARSYHEKLLDPAKNHVTNVHLKSAKNS